MYHFFLTGVDDSCKTQKIAGAAFPERQGGRRPDIAGSCGI
jgi:hypothetical protein